MRALVTGITGQDGYYLSKLLLARGYEVYGLIRGQNNPKRFEVLPDVELVEGDLTDYSSLVGAIQKSEPTEVYNLGAISHVGISFGQPEHTANVTGLGCLRLLEAIRQHRPKAKFYQASTSELFGKVRESPQRETTPFHPRSPYGNAKAFAHYSTVNYRESYGLHASCGILFNHESERRGYEFVTRKVTQGAARISLKLQDKLSLGNIYTYRDWGYAPDYVDAMWKMMQQENPGDYVIATGKTYSIRDLLRVAFGALDLEWEDYVVTDQKYTRPAEVALLHGDASKAMEEIDWWPTVDFKEMITRMVTNDLMIESEKVRGSIPNN